MLSSAFRHDRVHHAHNVASMTVRMGGDAKAFGGSGRPLSPAVAARVAVKTTVSDGAVPRHLRPSMPQRTADGHATHHFSSCSGGKKNPPCGKCATPASPCNGSWYRTSCATRLPRVKNPCCPESKTHVLSEEPSPLSVGVIAQDDSEGRNIQLTMTTRTDTAWARDLAGSTRHGAVHR